METSFVVVQARADGEKAETLPELKAVGQILAAGCGATGIVAPTCDTYSPSPVKCADMDPDFEMSESSRSSRSSLRDPHADLLDVPAFLRHDTDHSQDLLPGEILATFANDISQDDPLPTTLAELEERGFPVELLGRLALLVENEGHQESEVVQVCIALLAHSAAGAGLSTEERATLVGTVFGNRNMRAMRAAIVPLIVNATADAWGTKPSLKPEVAS